MWSLAAGICIGGEGTQVVAGAAYMPAPGGWALRIRGASAESQAGPASTRPQSGTPAAPPPGHQAWGNVPAVANPREHRRPLFPAVDKSLIWTAEECARSERVTFRPMVLAYNAPRFLFDYHSAGGLLGHLQIGLAPPGTEGKWFHQWDDIDVRYVNGAMEYELADGAYPGVRARLHAVALSGSAGIVVRVQVEGGAPGAALVWAYGGASAFFTNWNVVAPQFRYAPEHCAKDSYTVGPAGFELVRAFDKTDGIVGGEGKSLSVMRALPEWKARIRGGSSPKGETGFGAPDAFAKSPRALLEAADWGGDEAARTRANCVVVQRMAVDRASGGFIVVGMGGNIAGAIAQPDEAFNAGMKRNEGIAARIRTKTPDPRFDAANTMMAFATEGTWASQAYVHGGWSWRYAYLGWRILYGPTCLGWTERVRTTIRNQCRLGHIEEGPDAGSLSCMLESKAFFYNMNEVFLDMVRHYYEYTDDVELMREIFPALEGTIARENRRLRPDGGDLYENALNTWISDSHWYIRGQCTQASAYMLRAHQFLAEVAPRLGKDPGPFRAQAVRIREAMQRELWQKRAGVFAEYRDTRGHRLLHTEPELPTIYHAAEFGAADPLQVWQMLHWADTHLTQESTPGGGRLYWSSNWHPNHGRSYTHSTYELAYAEELNFAETNYLAGRADVGYALLRAGLAGIFNGPTPGGLSCHSHTDGTQRANDEFADASSMWVRTVCEGLFGIRVNRPQKRVHLSPQLPRDWAEASIETPHFSYTLRQAPERVDITWKSPAATEVALRLPVQARRVLSAKADGRELAWTPGKGVDVTWLQVTIPASEGGVIEVAFEPDPLEGPKPVSARRGEPVSLTLPGGAITEWLDPQGLLAQARLEGDSLVGTADGDPGAGVLFVSSGGECPRWTPVRLEIAPATPVVARTWSPPQVSARDLAPWELIDLSATFNAKVSDVPKRLANGAIPPEMPADQVGFNYWLEHVIVRSKPPSDAAWRAKIGTDDIAWTTDGIPFRSPKEGSNIAAVCLHSKAFPASVSLPVGARGRTVYLMVSGMTHPNQSHVVNARCTLKYADGSREVRDLVNPFDIGDCWSTWCGPYFDTPANGFENIGGRSGPAGSSQVQDRSRPVAVDTIAHLVAFPLKPGIPLEGIDFEAIANDIVFGVMGISVLK